MKLDPEEEEVAPGNVLGQARWAKGERACAQPCFQHGLQLAPNQVGLPELSRLQRQLAQGEAPEVKRAPPSSSSPPPPLGPAAGARGWAGGAAASGPGPPPIGTSTRSCCRGAPAPAPRIRVVAAVVVAPWRAEPRDAGPTARNSQQLSLDWS